MLDWLNKAGGDAKLPEFSELCVCAGVALALGFVVEAIYQGLLHRRGPRSVACTLVLLTVLISMVTLVIGDSTARAFGLVGALSIVRFRSVVEDTRDTAFVIFAVVVGMAVGARYWTLAVLAIPTVMIAALVMQWVANRQRTPSTPRSGSLVVRLNLGLDAEALLRTALNNLTLSAVACAVGTVKQGSLIEVTYQIQLAHDTNLTAVIAELNRVEGVQGAELKMDTD